MAAQATQTKVLRIGIIQDGKIVQERLIKAGETVTVGESAKNTFVFPRTQLERAEFPLFVAKGGSYHLHFTEMMKGKISSDGAVVGLDKLRGDPSVVKQGGTWRLALTERDRGKISVDNVTVLFQFVPPPPVQAVKPLERMDFRAKLIDDEDPALFGFLTMFGMIALLFVVFIALAPPVQPPRWEEVGQRLAHVVQEKKEEKKVEKAKQVDPDEKGMVADEPTDAPKETASKPKNKVEAARQKEQRKEALRSRFLTLQLSTRGQSATSTNSAYENDTLAKLEDITGSGSVTTDRELGPRKGSGEQTGDIKIDDLGTSDDVGTSSVTSAPAVQIKGKTETGSGDISEVEGNSASVEKVVQTKAGQLNYCYEDQLRSDPDLGGRVEVQWVINGGIVRSASVTQNTTGNDALAMCIVKKIKRWRFDGDISGPVSWPFVFRKK